MSWMAPIPTTHADQPAHWVSEQATFHRVEREAGRIITAPGWEAICGARVSPLPIPDEVSRPVCPTCAEQAPDPYTDGRDDDSNEYHLG